MLFVPTLLSHLEDHWRAACPTQSSKSLNLRHLVFSGCSTSISTDSASSFSSLSIYQNLHKAILYFSCSDSRFEPPRVTLFLPSRGRTLLEFMTISILSRLTARKCPACLHGRTGFCMAQHCWSLAGGRLSPFCRYSCAPKKGPIMAGRGLK